MIDTSNWKEFKIGDLFDTALSKDDIQPKNIEEGTVPLVSSGKNNNGIIASIRNDTAKIWNAGTITVDMFGKTFYQPNPYHCVSHGRVNILISRNPISENIGMFLCSVIESITDKYEFSEMCTGDKLSKDTIKIPVTPTGEPDWEYMESYMKNIMEESEESIENLRKADNRKHLIDVSEWGEFVIGDYFEVEYGKFRPKDKLGNGDVNYVTTSGFNNGITDTIDVADHKGNCITVASDGALMGSAFYQEVPFSTSNIVSTLTPLATTPLNKYNALFLCALIFSKRAEFGWLGFKFSVDRVRNLTVKMPKTPTGEPDWEYMEEYMKNIEDDVKEKVNMLAM